MSGRAAEVAVAGALATIVTLLLAAPVLRAPSERVFGAPLVGRHHDPFTVMQGFAGPISIGVASQPLTDVPGAMIARVTGAVAAYNWLVLISFPLTAMAVYALARHLALSPPGAIVAALACAFSPFHFAHAAYHPHVAQVQWLPLYLLALWRCLDVATPIAVAALFAATLAVTFSNFYGGLIALVITPFAVAAYWTATRHASTDTTRRLAVTTAGLLLAAAAGATYAWWVFAGLPADSPPPMATRVDLFRYSARWWSYLVPPAAQPWLGPSVSRFWTSAGVDRGLLEQQVSLGWGVMVLAVIAIAAWWRRRHADAAFTRVPVLLIVAGVALVCSLSPERVIAGWTVVRPSAVLYELAPMFRSYARFGVIVQLMAALLAGIGADLLLRSATRGARLLCVAMVAAIAAEYAVAPSALWRDALPTAAHRWIMQRAEAVRVLDCVAPTPESASIEWLTNHQVTTLGPTLSDCAEPNLPSKLAAQGYTHLLLRSGQPRPLTFDRGLEPAAAFADSRILAVTAAVPPIYTMTMTGFSAREHGRDASWQWMGREAAWIIVNHRRLLTVAALDLEVTAFHHDRRISVWLDRVEASTFIAAAGRRTYRLGPFTFPAGAHELRFRAMEPPTIADDVIQNGDRRALSIAVGTWTWLVEGLAP